MIDLSKYEKILAWDEYYGWLFKSIVFSRKAVYLLKIGESLYVDETKDVIEESIKHISDVRKGIHPNSKMNDAYKTSRACEVYVLESVGLYTHALNQKEHYIRMLQPDLNESDLPLAVRKELWLTYTSTARYNVTLPEFVSTKLIEIETEQNIPADILIRCAVAYFLEEFCFANKNLLMDEGVSVVDNYMRPNLTSAL